MIEAERRDENCVLLSAWLVRLAAQSREVSVARKSRPANQKHGRVFVDIPSQSEGCEASICRRSVVGLATHVPDVYEAC